MSRQESSGEQVESETTAFYLLRLSKDRLYITKGAYPQHIEIHKDAIEPQDGDARRIPHFGIQKGARYPIHGKK